MGWIIWNVVLLALNIIFAAVNANDGNIGVALFNAATAGVCFTCAVIEAAKLADR